MVISANNDDDCHVKYRYAYDIYLNDKLIDHVIYADDEQGFVIVYSVDVNGEFIRSDEILKTESLYGKVKIVFKWWLILYQEFMYWYYRWFVFRNFYDKEFNRVRRNGILNFILTGKRL